MISHKYRCIYIQNAKAASSSIRNSFRKTLAGHNFVPYNRYGRSPPGTASYTHFINIFSTYFTFTFVRNPFDRFVSAWLHRFDPSRPVFQKTSICNHSLREYAELARDLWSDSPLVSFSSDREIGPHRVSYFDIGYERYHLLPQRDLLLDYNPEYYFGVKRLNSAPCSFIGRYENLEEDFRCLVNILGAPCHELAKENVSLSRRVGDKRKHHSDYYDKPTRQLVGDIYADDLDLLGYDFEDAGKTRVLNPLYDKGLARSRHADCMRFSVIGTLRSYKRGLVFLAKHFNDEQLIRKGIIGGLFTQPVPFFVFVRSIYYKMKLWLRRLRVS